MEKILHEQYIVLLIVKQMCNALTPEEEAELQNWIEADEEHLKAYELLRQTKPEEERERYARLDAGKAWKKYKARYGKKSPRKISYWTTVITAAMVILAIGILIFFKSGRDADPLASIVPGSSKAVLILEDGSQKDLSREEIMRIDGIEVKNDGTSIAYGKTGGEYKTTAYNELQIPRGGEYRLMLADGTQVWLNSQTKLRYPVSFDGEKREVWLEGEAYFQVAKDAEHPFVIRTRERVAVEVLGTSFNVRAYKDESRIETVLEEGVVKMSAAGQVVKLLPGNRSCYDCESRQMEVGMVDTRIFTDWRSGQFIFFKKRVEEILRDLSRWYDLEIFYRSEKAKDILFSGSVKKYDHITTLLEAMEVAGGITFEIKGKTLTVDVTQKE